MELFSASSFSKTVKDNTRLFQGLLPELIKKLILNSCSDLNQIRLPGKDDVWAPGFDGIVENTKKTLYVCAGRSVWEFGTTSNTLEKINADYEKRTKDSLGIEKCSTEFYLVVPYIWAFNNQGCSISKWEKNHQDSWKGVHIYDASIIVDWINSEPAVCAWLLEQIADEKHMDFSTVSTAWECFSSKTEPHFSSSLFLNGRDNEIDKLFAIWDNSIIRIKADTTIDAYGFCLSAILKDHFLSNTVIVINDSLTYKKLSAECKGKVFLLICRLDCDIISGNKTILCFNKEDLSIKGDIELKPLSKSLFETALKDMKLPDEQVYALYKQTHGNLLSFVRRFPGNAIDCCPKWATLNRIELLIPLLFLRNIDASNTNDQKLVSFLANESFDFVFQKYDMWANLEDTPVKVVESHYILINFEEAWEVFHLTSNAPSFTRFIQVIQAIVTPEKNQLPGVEGLQSDYKIEKHLHSMILNLVCFSNADDSGKCDSVIHSLLNSYSFPFILLEHLPLLVEVSPTTVMDFFKKDINDDQGVVIKCFFDTVYTRFYTDILSALDQLTLYDETRLFACDCLWQLCLLTRNNQFAYSNTPRESLMNALCLWNPHTLFTVKEKGEILKRYLSINEEYAVDFITDLLLKRTVMSGSYEGIKTNPRTDIFVKDYHDTTNELASLIFKKHIENHYIKGIKKLLREYYRFYVETIEYAANLFNKDKYVFEELVSLNYDCRQMAFNAIKEKELNPYSSVLKKWINITTPSDIIGENGWCFHVYYSHLFFDDDQDSSLNLDSVNDRRAAVLTDLSKKCLPEDLVRLVTCTTDEYQMGVFFARHLNPDLAFAFAKQAFAEKKKNILYGILNETSKKTCILILNDLSKEEQCEALSNLTRKDFFDWLDTPEKEHSFWPHQRMYVYDELVYRKLLKYNPSNLLDYYIFISQDSLLINMERIEEIINTINARGLLCNDQRVIHAFDELSSKMDKEGYYSESLASECSQLYEKGYFRKLPVILQKYYFLHPDILCVQLIKSKDRFCSLSAFEYLLPDYAFSNYPSFAFFVDCFMEKSKTDRMFLYFLGIILGKTKDDEDGCFPHGFVRDALEKYAETDLRHEVLNGKLNARGCHPVDDGTSELELAKKYKCFAKSLEIRYPETAHLLRELSEHYVMSGKQDRLISELGWEAF